MTTATLIPPAASPLSSANHRELSLAKERGQVIRKAARVATFNAWSTGIIAACSAPFAFSSLSGLLMTVGLSVVAWNEFRGRRRLLDFDPVAASILGWNQLGLLAMIVVYCAWMLLTSLSGTDAVARELHANPDLEAVLGSVGNLDSIYRQVVVALYGSVIVLSAIFQGSNAIYYFTRRKHLESYVDQTPEWVRDVQRAF